MSSLPDNCHPVYTSLFSTTIYRVTRIIVNDFESKKLYVVNFIHKQTLYRLMGKISEIMLGQYYRDSSLATVIIHNNVATRKNCTILQRQLYSTWRQCINANYGTLHCCSILKNVLSLSGTCVGKIWQEKWSYILHFVMLKVLTRISFTL